jgi:beta-glucosidase
LPIRGNAKVLVAGSAANDIGIQTGGWTISWQGDGNQRADFPNAESILEGISAAINAGGGSVEYAVDGRYRQKPDVAIVVFGEKPYAEMLGDRPDVDFPDDEGLKLLEQFKAAGIPTAAVFLSGRPLYVNPELNAAGAFVAAFLPGTEGGGIADVLIGTPTGDIRHDFKGRLSFSWPARPDQTRINVGDDVYDPLFRYGFGGTMAQDVRLDTLPTDYVVKAGAGDVIFTDGAVGQGWQLDLTSGSTKTAVTGPTATSADGSLKLGRLDRNRQEDSLRLQWTAGGRASATFSGGPVDWTRQANGDVALQISYRYAAAAGGTVQAGMGCGTECGATFALPRGDGGAWQTASIRLRCFSDKGTDLKALSVPLNLSSDGPADFAVSDVRLVSSGGGSPCPSMPTP